MKSAFVLAAALAQLAAGQATLQFEEVINAPTPTATAPPQVADIDEAAISASLSSVLTAVSATSTAAPAKFRVKRAAEPIMPWNPWNPRPNNNNNQFCHFFPWRCPKPKPTQPTKPEPTPKPTPTGPPPQDNQCNPQPIGSGPTVTPDDPDTFVNFPAFSEAALSASTPFPYKQVFQNLKAAYSGYSYITYQTLTSYDTNACAAFCESTKGCSSFNIYFERSPTLAPGPNCPNPASTTDIVCALWGSAIDAKGATNNGQFREQFQVVIAGSNGYSKPGAPIDVPGYHPPDKCPNGSIGDKGKPWWLKDHFFAGFFAPKLCKIFAEIQHEKNKAEAIAKGLKHFSPVNAYNAFELWEDEKMIGTYCKLYTEPLPIDWCDYKGETKLGKLWQIKNAWFYKLINKKFGDL